MEDNNQSNENTEQIEGQDENATRARRKKTPCTDCVRNGASTGLQDASTLCPTCEGHGFVRAVV